MTSLGSGSKTRLALGDLANTEINDETNLVMADAEAAYYLWIADEGCLNADALHHQWRIPLYRLLLVQVKTAQDVWRVGLEAIQTGLFSWVFLRPSQACDTSHLRKLQL